MTTHRARVIMLSKIRHTQKEKYCTCTLTCKIQNSCKTIDIKGTICEKKEATKKWGGERVMGLNIRYIVYMCEKPQ